MPILLSTVQLLVKQAMYWRLLDWWTFINLFSLLKKLIIIYFYMNYVTMLVIILISWNIQIAMIILELVISYIGENIM